MSYLKAHACLSEQAIAEREDAIKAHSAELHAANVEKAMAHARAAALWISCNRPDVAMGTEPDLKLVADDDSFTLPELEDFGRAGNAIKLCKGEFGELWWCDPEGRPTTSHTCLLQATKATQTASPRTILLRYFRP